MRAAPAGDRQALPGRTAGDHETDLRASWEAITPLLVNLGAMRDNFDLVANQAERSGSMMREFETRSSTTDNTLVLILNTVSAIATKIGNELLPQLDRVADKALEILRIINAWAGTGLSRLIEDLNTIDLPGGRSFKWFGKDQAPPAGTEPVLLTAAQVISAGKPFGTAAPTPGRATGGPVRADGIYKWMENGREMFVPAVDGKVMSARDVAALKAQSTNRSATFNATFDIHAAPGLSARDVAREIERRMREFTRAGSPLHDGGAYA